MSTIGGAIHAGRVVCSREHGVVLRRGVSGHAAILGLLGDSIGLRATAARARMGSALAVRYGDHAVRRDAVGPTMTPLETHLVAVLTPLSYVRGIYALSSLVRADVYANWGGTPCQWVVAVDPWSPRNEYEVFREAIRVLGRSRASLITCVDGSIEARGPLLQRAKRLELSDADRERVARAAARTPTVLIVADDPRFQRRAVSALDEIAVSVLIATFPGKAISILQAQAVDLVIVDAAMVGMHAAVFCEWMAESRPDLLARTRVSIEGATQHVIMRIALTRMQPMDLGETIAVLREAQEQRIDEAVN